MPFLSDLFKKTTEEVPKTRLEKLVDYFSSNESYKDSKQVVAFLKKISSEDGIITFCDEDFLYEIICKIYEKNSDFNNGISMAKSLFNLVIYDAKDEEQKKLFNRFFELYLMNPEYFNDVTTFSSVYDMFENKKLVLGYYRYLIEKAYSTENAKNLIDYIKSARQFYVDENAFYSAILQVADKIGYYEVGSQHIKNVIHHAILSDRNSAGIYDVSEESIYALSKTVERIKSDIDEVDSKAKQLDLSLLELSQAVERKVGDLIENKTQIFTAQYEEAVALIKKLLESGKSLGESQQTLIQQLGEKYLTLINQLLNAEPKKKSQIKRAVVEIQSTDTVNPFLDPKVAFNVRLQKATGEKRKDELYHITFDKILKQILMNKPVMIVGPSGSGKSYTVRQISNLLNLRMYNFGFVTDEFAVIKGYNDANGKFVQTPFYEIYKNGGLCFFDEVDNSESKALMEINKIIGSGGYEPYLFPNGEIVRPHPNFRVVAAGNTWGDGADSLHTTRERLDGATINRFASIFYDYDPKLEKRIMGQYNDMYSFTLAFREVLAQRNYDDIISTRDMDDIRQYLDSGCFTIQEILEIKFIKNKRKDTLLGICEDLNEKLNQSNPILREFQQAIENLRVLKLR